MTNNELKECRFYAKQLAIDALASSFHEKWLNDYREKNSDTPRIKEISGFTFNINVPWNELNELWKNEQREIFTQYIEIYNPNLSIDEMAEQIHQLWMKLNSWQQSSSPHLFVPYNNLSDDEKEKDRNVVRIIKLHL